MARKQKSFSTYSDLRRSINAKIARAEKSGTIAPGQYSKLPALPKGTTGTEAMQAVYEARRFGETLQRSINRGRSAKRSETIEKQKIRRKEEYQKKKKLREDKREQEINAILQSFQNQINNIPLPTRELFVNEITGRDLIQAWFNAVKVRFYPEEIAQAIKLTYEQNFHFSEDLRYTGSTVKNAGAFVDQLNENLGETMTSYQDFFDMEMETEEGDSYII